MSWWRVHVPITGMLTVVVDAPTEAAALEQAWKACPKNTPDDEEARVYWEAHERFLVIDQTHPNGPLVSHAIHVLGPEPE